MLKGRGSSDFDWTQLPPIGLLLQIRLLPAVCSNFPEASPKPPFLLPPLK